jgi:hypothetical protein
MNLEKNIFAFLGAIIAGATLIGALGKPQGIAALATGVLGGTNQIVGTLVKG